MKQLTKLQFALLGATLATACAGDDGGDGGTGAATGTAGDSTGGTPDDGVDDGGDTMMMTTMNPMESTGPEPTTGGPDDTGADSTGGDSSGGDSGSDSGSGSGSTGAAGATVSGTIFRSAQPGFGGDAIGTIYLGLLVECAQDAEAGADGTEIVDADLSGGNGATGVEYTITGVPDGTYFLAGFMDDNGNADPDDPDADQGDLAAGSIAPPGPICSEFTVENGQAVTGVDLTFNLVLPF